MTTQTLITQTKTARTNFFQEHQPAFIRLASEGQAPQICFIGCDDSRVTPEAILGAGPGDLFVLRNIANVVPPFGVGERAVGASLEFAVRYLRVKHIVLCGHTDCGGVKALDIELDRLDQPHLARWIEYIRPAQTRVDARGVEPDHRHQAIVEQNVLLQTENLRTYDVVRSGLQAGKLTLHSLVFNLSTGRILFWDADIGSFVDESELDS